MTFNCWIKIGSTTSTRSIYSSDYWDSYWAVYYGFYVVAGANRNIAASFSDGIYPPRYYYTEDYIFNQNNWHFITTVFESSDNVRIYVDGVEKSTSQSGNTSKTNVRLRSGNYKDRIGFNYDVQGRYKFKGIIDEIRIYNRVLTVQEIQTLYNQGS